MEKFDFKLSKKAYSSSGLILSWFFLAMCLTLTGLISERLRNDIHLDERQKLRQYCEEVKVKIQTRLEAHKQTLLSAAAMFDASNVVTRNEWRAYVARIRLDKHFDGIQALGFSQWLRPDELTIHEISIHKEGFPQYHIKPEGNRDYYTSIVYIEPFDERNSHAFGYDMYSEPVRRKAMQYALDNNTVSLSGKVTLVQEITRDVQAGTLMYLPVYKKNMPIDNFVQRRDAIFGWVYSPFRMTDLLQNIISNTHDFQDSNLILHVYDGKETNTQSLLYQSSNRRSDEKMDSVFKLKTELDFYNTVWTLEFEQLDDLQKNVDYSKVWITLIAGTFISFLVFSLLRSYAHTHQNAEKIAFDLTKRLREKEKKLALINSDLLQFTSVSTHHLQEPVRRLVILSKRLQDELAGLTEKNESVATLLNFMTQSATRQQALVRDIQRYLSATTPRSKIELIHVPDIWIKIIEHNAALIAKTNADIDYRLLPAVVIDQPRLIDIFNVLLDNALRYKKPDRQPRILIYGQQKGTRTFYYVVDNGIGIEPKYRERVFRVFERLQVNYNNQDSTGIGLAIVKRIVESCDGSVTVTETAGGGTTVVFDLPNSF